MNQNKALARCAGMLLFTWLSAAAAVTPPFPTISGPVPDPDPVLGPMFPGIRPMPPGTGLADFNYVTEEYWISGTACGLAYKTRIVIRRPSDMSKFSGVVVAEPLHRGGNALIFLFAHWGILSRGHIGLEVDARVINLNNANNALQSLQPFNSTRYGSVGNRDTAAGFVLGNTNNSENNAQANTILASVGRLIKDTSEPTNPLKDWPIQKIVMGGTSDSSGAVLNYLTGSTGTGCTGSVGHLTLRMPDDGPIYDGFFRGSILNTSPSATLTDGVPHIEMPTQFELHSSSNFRKADSDTATNRYALQEQAGSSHNDTRDNSGFIPSYPGGLQCDGTLSRLHFGANYFRGLQQVIDWTFGIAPPAAPRMVRGTSTPCTFNGNTYSSAVTMDAYCNATAGVRSTYLDVPLFRYRIPNTGPGICNQTSDQQRFPDDVIASLYANPKQYLGKWKRRLNELVQQRWVMPDYVDFIRADAKEFLPAGPAVVLWRNSASGETYLYPIDSATSLGFLRVDTPPPSRDQFVPAIQAGEGYIRVVADSAWQIVGKGDFDGDGKDDVLWRNTSTGENYIYFLDGATIKPTEGYLRTVPDQAWQVAAVGDFDGDGKDDIFWRNSATGENYIYLMNGLTIAGEDYVRTVADSNWTVAGAGDVDSDGKADIVWRNIATGENYVYPMDGLAIKAGEGYLRTVADQNWQIKGVGDFDGDGSADIFWRNVATGENYLYPLNGTTILASEGYVRTVADQNWQVAGVEDYDGDGIDDVLWRNIATGENYIYPMHGTAVKTTEGYIRTVTDLNWQVKP